jgi:HEAT repeat protein
MGLYKECKVKMSLFGKPDIIKMEQAQDMAGLIQMLKYKAGSLNPEHVKVREKAADALRSLHNPLTVGPLIAAMDDPSYEVSRSAAWALGDLGDSRAVPHLISALRHPDWHVRIAAIQALANFQDERIPTQVVPLLIDPNEATREIAAKLLVKAGDKEVVAPMISMLKESSGQQFRYIADALCKLGDGRAILPLIESLFTENKILHEAAFRALVVFGSAAVEPLIATLGNPDKDRRLIAAKVLREIGSAATESILSALSENNELVREGAAKALDRLYDIRAVRPLLFIAQTDSSELVRLTAIETLIHDLSCPNRDVCKSASEAILQVGRPAVPLLIEVLQNGSRYSWNERMVAAQILGKIGDPQGVEPLIGCLRDSDGSVILAAVRALGRLGDQRAVDPLIALTAGNYIDFQYWVPQALVSIGKPALEPLLAALNHPNYFVSSTAGTALVALLIYDPSLIQVAVTQTKKGGASTIRSFILNLDREKRGGTVDVATSTSILKEMNDDLTVDLLIENLKTQDPDRWKTVCALGELGNPRAINALMDLLGIEDRHLNENVHSALKKLNAFQLFIPQNDSDKEIENLNIDTATPQRGNDFRERGKLDKVQTIRVYGELLHHSDEGIRQGAVLELDRLNDLAAADCMASALVDQDDFVRFSAAKALVRLGDHRALKTLIGFLPFGSEWVYGPEAAMALGELGDIQAVGPLINILIDGGDKTRVEAANALGNLNDIQAVGPLKTAAHDDEIWQVRKAAGNALEKLQSRLP